MMQLGGVNVASYQNLGFTTFLQQPVNSKAMKGKSLLDKMLFVILSHFKIVGTDMQITC